MLKKSKVKRDKVNKIQDMLFIDDMTQNILCYQF